MSSGKNVFILGSGFIACSVLDLLLQEGYTVSALVRSKEYGDELEKCGATAILGSLDDIDLIAQHTAKNNVHDVPVDQY